MKIDKVYYLIVCSRGIGSETIKVEDVFQPNEVSKGKEVEFILEKRDIRKAEKALEKSAVAEIQCSFNDEGPVITLRKGANIKDIWEWLKVEKKTTNDSYENVFGSDLHDELKDLHDKLEDHYDAFLSACLRAFIIHIKPEGKASKRSPGGGWTSCNSWRDGKYGKVSEALTEKQYKMVLSCGITIEELEQWDCRVMRDAFAKYCEEGRLSNKEW